MKNKKVFTELLRVITLIAMVASFIPSTPLNFIWTKDASAAAINLIADASFDQDINKNWFLWKSDTTPRKYSLVRAYETPFGYGPYSMSIEGVGSSAERSSAGIVSTDLNRFTISAGKAYTFSFYAKSASASKISVFLERADNYQTISAVHEVEIGNTWQKKQVTFTPSESGTAALSILFGDMPGNSTLYLDGFSLFENNVSLNTTSLTGYIGDKNKSLSIVNGNLLSLSELKIELPYFDEKTNTITVKQFSPKPTLNGTSILFDIPEQTFSGVGKVYASGSLIGQFDYNVLLKITEYGPNPALANEDLVVYGHGFKPNNELNFIVVDVVDVSGKITQTWLKSHIVDNKLSQVVVKLPVGIANGQLSARSYHTNLAGVSVENKSNSLSYVIKPSIYSLDWSRKGYEQIGDKITILGKGIASRPVVYFYDDNDKFISKTSATLKSVNTKEDYESIEVVTPKLLNKLKVTVKVGSIESDKADALSYSARPILKSIQTTKYRTITNTKIRVAAARPGDTIKLIGQGYKNASSAIVKFAGLNEEIRVSVGVKNIDPAGNWIQVIVPKQAQNGQISVDTGGKASNMLPLEIIPVVVSTTPLQPWPGEEMSLWVNGIGLDKSLVTVHFKLNNNETVAMTPTSLEKSNYGDVIVKVIVPKAIANDSSAIKLQYDNWLNDQSYALKTAPYIERAVMDRDSRVLTIKGHGFSSVLTNNKVIYKHADGTIVSPKNKIMSVKNTEEGQELKIQIIDGYYYGYVSITVNGETSNEFSVGPIVISKIDRRVQFVKSENRLMGVLYISGKNFGTNGGVKVGNAWANTHYRTNTFIIAVVESQDVNQNPVIITKN